MLLWESLSLDENGCAGRVSAGSALRTRRLPYDRQCAARTKAGPRCRGRIREGSDFCLFHDPALSEERKRLSAARGGRSRRRLTQIPDGYLRKLSTRRSIGDAMDRLYREIRLGVVTPEMGRVLFDVLTRLLDSGLLDQSRPEGHSGRARADRLRPKFKDVLTEAERRAWRKAVSTAPAQFLSTHVGAARALETPGADEVSSEGANRRALTAAS